MEENVKCEEKFYLNVFVFATLVLSEEKHYCVPQRNLMFSHKTFVFPEKLRFTEPLSRHGDEKKGGKKCDQRKNLSVLLRSLSNVLHSPKKLFVCSQHF